MQYRQHSPITTRVQERKTLPGPLKRPRLGFAIPNHCHNNQVRIIKSCPKGMCEYISKLTTFVNRARRWHTYMAGNTTGRGELAEKVPHSLFIPGHFRVDLAIGSF